MASTGIPRSVLRTLVPIRHFVGKPGSRRAKHGQAPGALFELPEALETQIHLMIYENVHFEEHNHISFEKLKELTERKGDDYFFWIDVQGFKNVEVLRKIAETFDISKLELEDALLGDQRPKIELNEEHLFAISRQFYFDEEPGKLFNEQLSLCIRRKILITFQENYIDKLEPVRVRLRNGAGAYIRQLGPVYLAYALMDAVVDHYFQVMQNLSARAEMLENQLFERTEREHMFELQVLRRQLAEMRRAVVPERDKMDELRKLSLPWVDGRLKTYFRDVFDNTRQMMDLIESLQETLGGLMDLYIYGMSNRQNEVMKVLTMVSTIFIPLSFVVGLYGMNFQLIDPYTNKQMPLNMPELRSPYGYVVVVLVMFLIVVFQLLYYRRKGWFRSR